MLWFLAGFITGFLVSIAVFYFIWLYFLVDNDDDRII